MVKGFRKMVVGGMYVALKIIAEILIDERKAERFTAKDLSEVSGLSLPASSNNCNRLMGARLLVREESRSKNSRMVCYRLNIGAREFIKNHLYEEEKERDEDDEEELRI